MCGQPRFTHFAAESSLGWKKGKKLLELLVQCLQPIMMWALGLLKCSFAKCHD